MTTKLWLYAMCGLALAPSAVTRAADDTGAVLYMNHCAACHGADGEGGGPVAVAMSVTIPNLRGLSERNGGVFPADALAAYVDGREAQASSRQSADAGMGRRVSRARARHRGAHRAPSRQRARGIPRDATVFTVGVLPTKLLEQRHRFHERIRASLCDRELVVSHGHIARSPAARVHGLHLCAVLTSKRTMSFQPFCAAPCSAVLPLGGRYA